MKNLGICLIPLIICNLIAQPIIWTLPNEDTTKYVPCYDKYGSEIQELTCESTEYGLSLNLKLISSIIVLTITGLLGFAFWRQDQ